MMKNLLKQFCLLILVLAIIECHFLLFQDNRIKKNINKHKKRKNRKLKKSFSKSRIIDGDDRSYKNTLTSEMEKKELRFNLLKSLKNKSDQQLNNGYKTDKLDNDYFYNSDNEKEYDNQNQNDDETKDKQQVEEKPSTEQKQCQVELKENASNQQSSGDSSNDKQNQQNNESENEEDICECNVKCIQNCENIKNGVEGLPVSKVDNNKYMIETYEEQNNTCFQSCKDNLQKLGCLVKEV